MLQTRKLAEIPDPGTAASADLVATLLFSYLDGRLLHLQYTLAGL